MSNPGGVTVGKARVRMPEMKSACSEITDPALKSKFEIMTARFGDLKRVIVAYSGGVDSTLALKVGTLAIGEACIGVTARSETLTQEDFELSARIAKQHGMVQRVVEYSELEIENYADNPINRCYFCKHELYSRLQAMAGELAVHAIVDGSNADDVGDYRPGLQATKELNVVSVLREAGMHKGEIREMARALGLPNWNKPAQACLSSRIPYGEKIDVKKLRQVEQGEAFLRELGFNQVRLRHHGTVARLEVEPGEIARLARPDLRDRVVKFMRSIGFQFVTLDMAGYRTGSLNEVLTDRAKETPEPATRSAKSSLPG